MKKNFLYMFLFFTLSNLRCLPSGAEGFLCCLALICNECCDEYEKKEKKEQLKHDEENKQLRLNNEAFRNLIMLQQLQLEQNLKQTDSHIHGSCHKETETEPFQQWPCHTTPHVPKNARSRMRKHESPEKK